MCGILGGSRKEWNYTKALQSIDHRGPNGSEIQEFGDFTLGFNRLAIMDLSESAMQPMTSEDGNITIVFNGEIYGFNKLKEALIKKGRKFRTHSDTEVILQAYLELGDNFIFHIDGMFAIAIYEKREKSVKLFRDRVGIKPLYYFYNGKEIAFASELKELLILCSDIKFEIDKTAIYDFFTYGYIPDPKSMYKNIFKLLPAHYLKYDIKNHQIIWNKRYWKLKANENEFQKIDTNEVKEEVHSLIKESVREQMISDVPIGSFLSGGIDSSVVSYEIKQKNPSIAAFSMGFTYKKYDELKYAQILAQHCGITNYIKIAEKKEINKLYSKLKDWYDEPFSDTSAFPTYLVSKLAHEKVTVVLTGDGGDEVFGGYSRYREMIRHEKAKKFLTKEQISLMYETVISMLNLTPPEQVCEKILEEIAVMCGLSGGMLKMQKGEWAKKLGVSNGYDDYWFFRKYYKKELPTITRYQYMDFHTYLPGDILTKVDRATMNVSLEARVPLLSKKLIEFLFQLPMETRCPKGELKGLLKETYRGLLPNSILDRKKMGFCIPNSFLTENSSQQEQIMKDLWYDVEKIN